MSRSLLRLPTASLVQRCAIRLQRRSAFSALQNALHESEHHEGHRGQHRGQHRGDDNSPLPVEEIVRLDSEHVWHPYASLPNTTTPCFPVERADGCTITLSDGRQLVDGMSSWWACIHGYNHPVLNEAAQQQIGNMSHMMFGGLTHEPAVRLAKTLSDMTPRCEKRALDKVFFCDSGSVAIEVAMKMALQYHYNLAAIQGTSGNPPRSKFLTISGGYHGDTFHAMSVCDPVNGMHHLFSKSLIPQIFCPRPEITADQEWNDDDPSLKAFFQHLDHNEDEIAAVILEPIVQGAGGMRFYHPNYLKAIREACDDRGILLIADEIATGFGRSGELFACQHADITPDILCVGKALSGGFLSFAAAITTGQVSEVFAQGPAGVLMHGPTFMGNPLACAVSDANLRLLQSYDWHGTVRDIETQLKQQLEPAKQSPHVQDVRVMGAIGVIEMKEQMNMSIVQPELVHEHGVWLRPFGKLLYTMPPFVIQKEELQSITDAMVKLAHRGPR